MNDDWMNDTTDVLHCSMPPQVRQHIEELRDEVARLREDYQDLTPSQIRSAQEYMGAVRTSQSIEIERLGAEIARLRAAEVPLSANVGFAFMCDGRVHGDSLGGVFPSADEAVEIAGWRDGEPVALIPVTAWDRA